MQKIGKVLFYCSISNLEPLKIYYKTITKQWKIFVSKTYEA